MKIGDHTCQGFLCCESRFGRLPGIQLLLPNSGSILFILWYSEKQVGG